MPDGVVDLVVSDPAYATISGGSNQGKGRPSGMLSKNDGKIFEDNDIRPGDYLPELYRVCADQCHVYLMSNFFTLEETMRELRAAGFKIHNLLIWLKNNVTPNRWYMKNVEYTIFARKGKAFGINNAGSKTCAAFDNPKSPKLHETEKPVGLMELYVGNSSKPGDLVYDPFFGAGATAVACQNLGRNFVGSETQQKYVDITEMRLLV